MSTTRTLTRKEQLTQLILNSRIGNLVFAGVPLDGLENHRDNAEQLRAYIAGIENQVSEGYPHYCGTGFQAGVLLLDHNYDEATLRSMSPDDIQQAFDRLADTEYYRTPLSELTDAE